MTKRSKAGPKKISEAWKELKNLVRVKVKLSQIYFDPNNPRLQTPDKQKVSDNRILEKSIQNSCLDEIKKEVGIKDLTESIRNSGFWTVDRIVLRPLNRDKYVVIEGNRRVAALQTLEDAHVHGTITLPPKICEGIKEFEALIYQGRNPDIAWIIQGFRHSPGIKKWEPYPLSMFLAKFEEESKKSPSDIASIFGMKTSEVTHSIRSFYGFEDAKKDEEYGDEVSPEKFGHFNEVIFVKKDFQNWLGWDDKKRKFKNKENLKKYISWSVPKEGEKKPRIDISSLTRDTLSKVIRPENKKILEKFEEEEIDLEGAKKELGEIEIKREPIDIPNIIDGLNMTKKVVETLPIPRLQLMKDEESIGQKDELLKIMKELKEILEAQIKNLAQNFR